MKPDRIPPYAPIRCDVHPRRPAACYVASGTGEVVRNGQVVKPGLAAGRNVCDECFEALVPRAIK